MYVVVHVVYTTPNRSQSPTFLTKRVPIYNGQNSSSHSLKVSVLESYMYTTTVEPQDTLNRGHLCKKDTFQCTNLQQYIFSETGQPLCNGPNPMCLIFRGSTVYGLYVFQKPNLWLLITGVDIISCVFSHAAHNVWG